MQRGRRCWPPPSLHKTLPSRCRPYACFASVGERQFATHALVTHRTELTEEVQSEHTLKAERTDRRADPHEQRRHLAPGNHQRVDSVDAATDVVAQTCCTQALIDIYADVGERT